MIVIKLIFMLFREIVIPITAALLVGYFLASVFSMASFSMLSHITANSSGVSL